jgi:hypothetical protein
MELGFGNRITENGLRNYALSFLAFESSKMVYQSLLFKLEICVGWVLDISILELVKGGDANF